MATLKLQKENMELMAKLMAKLLKGKQSQKQKLQNNNLSLRDPRNPNSIAVGCMSTRGSANGRLVFKGP